MPKFDFVVAMGGAPGQGLESAGPVLIRICARRGLSAFAYSAYQSLIRGGHTFLTIRICSEPVANHGDRIDMVIALNQDTMDKHLQNIAPGGAILYNSDNTASPDNPPEAVQLCPLSFKELSNNSRNKVMLNTLLLGATLYITGAGLEELENILTIQFKRKGQEVVDENIGIARASYNHAAEHFNPFSTPLPYQDKPLAVTTGNEAMAMGGAAAGVKFYCAYPMSPSTGVLHWMASNARDLGIMVRQVEDEIGVANMTIGAAHAGCRAMCLDE